MTRVSKLPPVRPAKIMPARVKLIKINPSSWWDAVSCADAINKALSRNGINPKDRLLYCGVSLGRRELFLKKGTDHPSGTVMAIGVLNSIDGVDKGALFYAFRHSEPMVAVYKPLESAENYDVYRLDQNHPTRGLLALIEL